MSGIYIPGNMIPTKCIGCTFRDPEYGGNCILMPSFDAETYEKQFDRCPFKKLLHWFGVPPHGRLIDADALVDKHFSKAYVEKAMTANKFEMGTALINIPLIINNAPTIIPADPADKEGE